VSGEAEFTVRSSLRAPPERVWERVTSLEGINDELLPLVRMTVPRGLEHMDLREIAGREIAAPTHLGRSWILLFGLLPFDYDDLVLVRVEPNRGFLERSRMLSQRLWEHERTLEPDGTDGCTLTDRVRFAPRGPLPARWLRPILRRVFRHRHRRLRRHFGGESV
jgi:ligand-binding SRPBCC domain-containing protein